MATSLTRYLKLKIDSALSSDAKYNLNKIDSLGASGLPDNTGQVNIRSATNILIEAESPDVGGSGNNTGTIQLGENDNKAEILFYSTSFKVSSPIQTKNTYSGSTNYLSITYNSNDNVDRTLTIDVNGNNRTLTVADSGTIVTKDGSNSFSAGTITATFVGSLTGNVTGNATNVSGVVDIANGGTGAVTATGAINALLPSQSGNADKILKTNGTNVSWAEPATGQVKTEIKTWLSGTYDGTTTEDGITFYTKNVTHTVNTENVDVTIRNENNQIIYLDIEVISSNNIQLTSSEIPVGNWTITIQGAP